MFTLMIVKKKKRLFFSKISFIVYLEIEVKDFMR